MTDQQPQNFEVQTAKRTKLYRAFEILPGFLSYSVLLTVIFSSIFAPSVAEVLVLIIVTILLVKSLGMSSASIRGYRRYRQTDAQNWRGRLGELADPSNYEKFANSPSASEREHAVNIRRYSLFENPPSAAEVHQAVIVALYNESFDVIKKTLKALTKTKTTNLHVFVASEPRGVDVAERAASEFKGQFAHLEVAVHKKLNPGEVKGKGANIASCARTAVTKHFKKKKIAFHDVIVTTLDADNRVDPQYFDYLTYNWLTTPDRQQVAFQPTSLYVNNIWEAFAPVRIVASANSINSIVLSVRPNLIRNFAAHSQGLWALSEMNFWSTKTICEDGHQYWRSYFFFDGDYRVIPLFMPIRQDAVFATSFFKAALAQFKQMRRWAYGVSDVPYVAVNLFSRTRTSKLGVGIAKLGRLLEGHFSQSYSALILAVGGWMPFYLSISPASTYDQRIFPGLISSLESLVIVSLAVTILFTILILPKPPASRRKRKIFYMFTQWLLMPIIGVTYTAFSVYYAQTRLMFGAYLDFEVTQKK